MKLLCVEGIEIALVFMRGVEIDFGFVCGPIMTWFYFMDRKWLGFSVGIEIDLVFCVRAEVTCF